MRATARRLISIGTLTALTLSGSALAAQTNFDDIDLTGSGTTVYNYGGPPVFNVEDAESSPEHDDAFDGGLVTFVGERPYLTNPGGTANLVGDKQVSGQVQKLGKLKVQRTDSTYANLSTIRSLIKLQNPTKKKVKTSLTVASNLGSDEQTAVRASSNGDLNFNAADRWGVTSDDATTPGDTVVTLVNYGKGKVQKAVEQTGPVSGSNETDATGGYDQVDTRFQITVPKRRSVYLMVFAEVNESNSAAISAAAKFNARGLGAELLTGISEGVRKKIVNWQVG